MYVCIYIYIYIYIYIHVCNIEAVVKSVMEHSLTVPDVLHRRGLLLQCILLLKTAEQYFYIIDVMINYNYIKQVTFHISPWLRRPRPAGLSTPPLSRSRRRVTSASCFVEYSKALGTSTPTSRLHGSFSLLLRIRALQLHASVVQQFRASRCAALSERVVCAAT